MIDIVINGEQLVEIVTVIGCMIVFVAIIIKS